MITLRRETGDDPTFVEIIENCVDSLIRTEAPGELYLIEIDHWFDFKWRHFVGKFLGAAGFWNKQVLRIPPFIPDRVASERYFELVDGYYVEGGRPGLHLYQPSGENITGKRRLTAVGEPRLFVWYSGGTKQSLRGSLMAYVVRDEGHRTFYISLLRKSDWRIFKTDGLSRSEASALMKQTRVIT